MPERDRPHTVHRTLGLFLKVLCSHFYPVVGIKSNETKQKLTKKQLEKEKNLLNIILPGHSLSLREESGQELKARTRAESIEVYFLASSFFI